MAPVVHNALQIAHWFVAWAEELDADLSNLKLQKLLYYAQGEHIGATGRKLFFEPIQAWQHGPVVAEVYHEAKKWGRNPIDPDEFVPENFDWDDYSDVQDELVKVWREYGVYSAWALREKTHGEAPWVDAFHPGRNVEITDAALKAFFGTH
ncbi:SocA family protein [Corynebacterium sp. YIM 101645]|uniref:SocA family protein n=1 Tax=Corynebacterium lemuris TaxID=1859292 RepID=A0ABT2FYK0_9CORY|nr:Panacea domain-containing protein [Corynebacterium lemuris]MCS5479855.1 SocA family protein [Corynebacterium lemuris]